MPDKLAPPSTTRGHFQRATIVEQGKELVGRVYFSSVCDLYTSITEQDARGGPKERDVPYKLGVPAHITRVVQTRSDLESGGRWVGSTSPALSSTNWTLFVPWGTGILVDMEVRHIGGSYFEVVSVDTESSFGIMEVARLVKVGNVNGPSQG